MIKLTRQSKGESMYTIQLQVQDSIYNRIIGSGIDIQARFDEFITDFIDDSYPSISKSEAKQRVIDGVIRYQNQTGEYIDNDMYQIHISDSIAFLRAKYADNQR